MTLGTTDPDELERQGLSAYQEGRREEAAARLQAAIEGFRRNKDAVRAAEAANNLSVVLLQLGQARRALEVVQGTASVFEGAGDPVRAAQAVGNEAAALEAMRRYDEAERFYREAAERLHHLHQPEAEAHTRQALAALLLRRGRPLEAVESAEVSLQSGALPGWGRRGARALVNLLRRFIP